MNERLPALTARDLIEHWSEQDLWCREHPAVIAAWFIRPIPHVR
jgi:hypothetical protein